MQVSGLSAARFRAWSYPRPALAMARAVQVLLDGMRLVAASFRHGLGVFRVVVNPLLQNGARKLVPCLAHLRGFQAQLAV